MTVSVAGVPGITELGVTEHCGANCGDGETEQVSETELLKPPTAVTSRLEVADCPGLTVSGESVDVETEKSADRAAIRGCPFILPHPVVRS